MISRELGASVQGVFGLFNSYLGALLLIGTLGLELANNYFASDKQNIKYIGAHLGNTTFFSFVFPIFLSTIILILNRYYDFIKLDQQLLLVCLFTIFISIQRQLVRGYIYGLGLFYHQFIGIVLFDFLSLMTIFVLYYSWPLDLLKILYVQFFYLVLSLVYWFVIIFSHIQIKLSLNLDLFIDSLKRGLRIFSSNVLVGLSLRVNFFIIAYYYEEFDLLGFYSISVALSEIVLNLPLSLTNVVLNKSRLNDFDITDFLKTLNSVLLIIIPFFLLISFYFIPLVFGSEFEASFLPLIFLLIGSYFYANGNIISYIMVANDESLYTIASSIFMLISMFVLSFILVPNLGIIGASLSSMGAYFTFCISQFIFYSKNHEKTIFNSFLPNYNLLFKKLKSII